MNKKLIKIEIINTIIVFILGIFLHFTYNLFHQNIFIGIFSAINESVWEHLKLVFMPMLITTIFSYFLIKDNYPNYLKVKTKSILIALAFIIIFFYTYSGILGKNIPFLDISSFFIAIILSEYYTFKNIDKSYDNNIFISVFTLSILLFAFILFTFISPKIGIFISN